MDRSLLAESRLRCRSRRSNRPSGTELNRQRTDWIGSQIILLMPFVTVHMSADGKLWKKEKLTSLGVIVKVYDDDSKAVEEGRYEAHLIRLPFY
ncbi:hypothetical protein OKW24_003078 [Peribacillus simplex]|nr:hypothetical protein [Peribacillus simplex]